MINISPENKSIIDVENYEAFKKVYAPHYTKILSYIVIFVFVIFFLVLFLPWTQNVKGSGKLTTFSPNERPQTIQSIIGGRIDKWYIKEGDFVKKGDTICHLTEVKEAYLDPNLLKATDLQIQAKSTSIESYNQKINSQDEQIKYNLESLKLKLNQAINKNEQNSLKIIADSNDFIAASLDYEVAQTRFKRQEELYNKGLVSLTDFETRKLKFQETNAKKVSTYNKFISTKSDLLNSQIEYNSIKALYADKLSELEGKKQSSISDLQEAQSSLLKLKNQYVNYSTRNSFYYILANQDGYVQKLIKSGLGETVKEGDAIVSILPKEYQLMLEMYVDPMDQPLLHKAEKVRIQFDGWPVFVFSGWPGASFGTFSGRIYSVDRVISDNGKFRVLVLPDPEDDQWPEQLKVGSGANSWALLGNVPIWYELWRVFNGFPANFYYGDTPKEGKEKKK